MKPIRRSPMPRFLASILLCATMVAAASGSSPASPSGMASALEGRIVSGEGVTLPDAEREIARAAGTVDLAAGDWPDAFLVRAGEKVCVAVSPFTGCYEFFDESGSVFWTVVPVLPTTDNWVAPFRLLGLDAEVIFLHPFGYINPINLVGIGQCNNPFFSSTNAVVNTPMASPDDIRREYFSNHMYVLFDGTVFDACAGPSLGTQTHATYLSTVVDTSTSSERSPSWASPKQCGSETNHINFGHIPEVK